MRINKFGGFILAVIILLSGLGLSPVQAQNYSASFKFLKSIKEVNYQEIKMAIEKGVNINTRDYDDDATALIISARKKETPLVGYLLANGAKPDLVGHDGKTALLIAVGIGDKNMVQLLLKAGADVNLSDKNGTTPLIASVMAKKDRITEYLIKVGADYTLEDYSGRSPLQYAIDGRRRRAEEILRKAGATR